MNKRLLSILIIMTSKGLIYSQTNIVPNPSGNVGIGVSGVPTATLQVGSGTGNLHFGNNGVLIKFNSGDRALLELHSPGGENRLVMQSLANATYLGSLEAKPLYLQTEGGNVAIGNGAAEAKLDIWTSTPNDGVLLRYSHPTNGGFIKIHANSLIQGGWNGITTAGDAGIIYGSGVQSGNSYSCFGFVIAPWYNGYAGLRLDKDGNVGIATSDTKGYRLAVNGDAIFTKVKVKAYNNWPDYVFQSSFRLRPLSEVEKYIQQHHHLPEVPSAAEVKQEGLDLGDNQATLLKKIEELTLYLIEQNKTNDAQHKLLEEQSRQLKQQQRQIEALKKQVQQIK